MAVRAETQIDLTRVDNGTPGSDGTMLYATCTTAAATAAKVGTLSPAVVGFTLQTGCMVVVNFSNTNSSSSATFNLNSTGAYGVRYKGAALTSTTRGYLAANRLVILQFDGTYWEITGSTTDSNNYDRTAYKAALTATGPISAGRIGVINSSGNIILLSTTPFDMTGPIVYIGTAYTSDALTQTNNYTMYGTAFNLANTVSGFTGTAGAAVFIKGTISGKMFTPDAGVLTTTVPSTADGKIYMLLGTMSTTTNGVLAADHPCYAYSGGAFKLMPGEQGPQGIQGPTGPAGPGLTYVTLQNGDDMNSCIAKDTIYVTSQTAVCNSLLNMPTGFPAGELRLEIEWMGSNDYLVQHLYCKNGAIKKTYLRTYSNGTFGAWTEEGVVYGTSSTAAATAAKTATVDNYELDSKQYFAVKFDEANTADNPTLSVNGGTAKQIHTNGAWYAYWEAGATVNFYYDGTCYQVASSPVYASTVTVGNPNGDHVFIGNSGVQINNGSNTFGQFDQTGLNITDGASHDIAHLGYGSGNGEGGTANNPYYTLGARKSGSSIGNYSLGAGYNVTASAVYSVAFGKETTAAYGNQLVTGKYNNNKSTDLFEIGNGTSTSNRKNVFEVNTSGDVTAGGDVNCTKVTASGNISTTGNISASGTGSVTGELTAGAINGDSLFSRESYSINVPALSSGSYADDQTLTKTKAGYYPIGVVGFNMGARNAYFYRATITSASSGSVTVTFSYRAVAATSATTAYIQVLWVKITA